MLPVLQMQFFHMRKEAKNMAGWTLFIALYNIFTLSLYDNYRNNSSILQVYSNLPDFWKNFLGQETMAITEFSGWMGAQFFAFLPIIAGVYIALLWNSLVVKEMEDHSMEFWITQGMDRWKILLTKASLQFFLLLMLMMINYLLGRLFMIHFNPQVVNSSLLFFYRDTFGVLLFFSGIYCLLSQICREQKQFLSLSLGILLLLFLLNSLLMDIKIPSMIKNANPFAYFDPAKLSRDPSPSLLGWGFWIFGWIVGTSLGLLVFQRKDIL